MKKPCLNFIELHIKASLNKKIEVELRRGWVDNIKMDLREIGWDGMDWIDLAPDRYHWRALVNTVTKLRVP
jgi:hypothetical protein